jgi:hypothetical protein
MPLRTRFFFGVVEVVAKFCPYDFWLYVIRYKLLRARASLGRRDSAPRRLGSGSEKTSFAQ